MMMSEFIERTGFEPTAEEYEKIEDAYYRFDGSKDEFCKNWLAEGGILKAAQARAEKISQLRSELLELDHANRMETDGIAFTPSRKGFLSLHPQRGPYPETEPRQ